MDKATAVQLARRHLDQEYGPPAGDEWVVLEQFAALSKLGWVFSYNTRSFVETGDINKAAAIGNGPLLIRDDNKQGWFFPSAYSVSAIAQMIDADDAALKRWLPGDLA